MTNCKICGRPISRDAGRIKIKYGSACTTCYGRLPLGVRMSRDKFTAPQIRELQKVASPVRSKQRIWIRYGGFSVSDRAVVLNGTEYRIPDLESVSLGFHPHAVGQKPGTAYGTITVVLVLKKPHILIEEMISDKDLEAGYTITGMDISYQFPKILETAVRAVMKAVTNKNGLVLEALRYFSAAESASGKDAGGTAGQQKKEAQENRTPYEQALDMFQVQRPFTKEELRRKRNQYITANHIHPDDGGNGEAFRKVQEAYGLLIKFASD